MCRAGIALGVGELPREVYADLFDAGAHRYLLRIETSDPKLYAAMHPPDHSWERRRDCLLELKSLGYQTGTGIMIGFPGQTLQTLAQDVAFFKAMTTDMVGMGPYVLQKDTPLGAVWLSEHGDCADPAVKKAYEARLFELSTRMLAVTRVALGNVNIAATTALQVRARASAGCV